MADTSHSQHVLSRAPTVSPPPAYQPLLDAQPLALDSHVPRSDFRRVRTRSHNHDELPEEAVAYYIPSPTADSLRESLASSPPQAHALATAASSASHISSGSSHSQARSSHEPEPAPSHTGQHYHNPAGPSSYPPRLDLPYHQHRRESDASYDHLPNHHAHNGHQLSPTFLQQRPAISRPAITIYYFRPAGHNSMILYTQDNTPRYHVEVTLNCFMPTSYLATIRRVSLQGEFVASFEMGINSDKSMLSFGTHDYLLENVFQNFRTAIRSNAKGRWVWRREAYELEWNSHANGPESKCLDAGKKEVARIRPPTKPGRSTETVLEVHISAQHILDDIVVSSIIVEHKRQTPSQGTRNDELFG